MDYFTCYLYSWINTLLLISYHLCPLGPSNGAMTIAHHPSLFSELKTSPHHFLQYISRFDKFFRNIQEPSTPSKKKKRKKIYRNQIMSYLGQVSLPCLNHKRLNSRSRMEGLWARGSSPAPHLAFRAQLEHGSKKGSDSFLL
uniref:Uncharacterized protein n=1 Tax=Myotis myotis TaxID=51298 RepID=A0A7J7Z460_MYOMY|nr:hypothetical protein mMyoMyo1_010458 [Myotis myotis]